MKKILLSVVLILFGITTQLTAQVNGTAARPLVSTAEKPVYYYIESASAQSGYTGNVLLTRASTNVKLRHAPKTTLNNDSAMWQIVYESGTTKLKNKLTNNYMSGSHTNAGTGDAFTTTLYSGQTYYKMQSGGQSPTLAFNSNLCDRQTTEVDRLHWYFIVAPGSEDNYYYLTFGTPVIPEVSTPESPVYYYIESASSGTGVNPVYLRGNYIISPKTSGSRLKWGIKSQAGDSALWAIVNESGTIKLKNKATGLYMSGSHTGLTTGDAFTYTAYDSPDQLQYKINSGGQSPTVAWNSNLCDRYSDQGANSRTAWYFIGPVGPTGNALNLNGTSQYMRIPHNAAFNFSNTEEFSISFWVNSNLVAGRNARMISKRGPNAVSTDKSGYEIWGLNSTTNFMAVNTTTGTSNTNLYSVWGTVTGAASTWTHIAYVVTGSGTDRNIIMYQNGQVAGSAKISEKDVSAFSVTNLYDVMIGKGQYEGGAVNGKMDNIRFWSKGLMPSEVEADQTSNVSSSTPNLIAAYDFEGIDAFSTTAPDISGNGHNGTLVNYNVLTQEYLVGRGNLYDPILKAQLNITSELTLNNLVLNLAGTTSLSDITKIRVYSTGSSDSFDERNPTAPLGTYTPARIATATLLGECDPASGDITCTLSGTLSAGTNYLWITAEISGTATEGNKIDMELKSITHSTDQVYTPALTNPAGTTDILLRRELIFAPGDYNSRNYRIPAMIVAADNSLVLVTDKRKYNSSDLPQDIDVVCRRSTDNGATWSEPVTIALGTGSGSGFGDVSLIKTKSNKLVAVFVGGPAWISSTATNPIRIYVSTSNDNGISWSAPQDITSQIYGSGCTDPTRRAWYGVFCGSGSGLCMRNGRIMVTGVVRAASAGNYAIYSDDEGVTWNVSSLAIAGGDEAKIVELNNGKLLMSSRNSGHRLWASSADGGLTWTAEAARSELEGNNACNGEFTRFTSTLDGDDKNRIVHTLPNNTSRQNVTIWVSYDEGATWPDKKVLCPGPSAYSCARPLPDGTLGVYLEEDAEDVGRLYFMKFSTDWMTDGVDENTTHKWTGATSSSFNEDSNWASGTAPTPGSDVDIAFVENAVRPLIIDTEVTLGDVLVNPGAQLEVASGGVLTISNLTLMGDGQNQGTLLNNGTLNVSGNSSYSQLMASTRNTGRNWYISSPVSDAISSVVIGGTKYTNGFRLWSWDEPTYLWNEITATNVDFAEPRGYVAYIPKDSVVTFTGGSFNDGNYSINFTRSVPYTGGSAGYEKAPGFHLVGNPYPSYVKWNSVNAASTNIRATKWYRSVNTAGTYVFDSYNGLTGTTLNWTGVVTEYIPPMQSVWIQVTTEDPVGATVNFTNAMRSHQDVAANRFRAPKAENDAQKELHLKISNGKNTDETIVLFNPITSDGQDIYDAPKMSNNNKQIPEIYTMLGTDEMVINCFNRLQNTMEIPLGFRTGEANSFTLTASDMKNFDNNQVLLRNNISGEETVLEDGTTISFSSAPVVNDNMFSLILRAPGTITGVENGNAGSLFVYTNSNRQIVVIAPAATLVNLFNATGQRIVSKNMNSTSLVIDVPAAGVYMVNAGGETYKVVVR